MGGSHDGADPRTSESDTDQLAEGSEPSASTPAPAVAKPARAPGKQGRAGPRLPPDLLGGRFFACALCLLLLTPLASAQTNNIADELVRKVYEWAGSPLDDRPPNTSTWTPGTTTFVNVTLVTEDELRLGCASDEVVADELRCQMQANKRPWPRDPAAPLDDNKVSVIQPYRTLVGNELILMSGVWAQPEIAVRAHQEPAGVVEVNRQSRFVAYCKVRFHAKFDEVLVRWFPGAQWFTEKNVPVAEVLRCATHDFRRDSGNETSGSE